MKDQEFIELLNLYLDHEISTADAARLEAEVQRSPARYRVYREYCQMHKAVALLSPAPAGEAPAVAELEAGSRSRNWFNPLAIGGVMAAAAAVAFVFWTRGAAPASKPAGGAVVAEKTAASASAGVASTDGVPARTIGQTVSVLPARSETQRPVVTQTLRWNVNELPASTPVDARFNWIQNLEFASVPQLPAEAVRFDSKSLKPEPQRAFGPAALEAPGEYNAIQFQK